MRISIPEPRSVALAVAATATLAAAVPGQGRADVCAEYRAAIAFEEAATAAAVKLPLPDLNSRAAFDEYARTGKALFRVVKEARVRLRNAERAVRDVIEDEYAGSAIDALAAIEGAHAAAMRAISSWLGPRFAALPGSPAEKQWLAITVNDELPRGRIAVRDAYRAALSVACAGGLARAGE